MTASLHAPLRDGAHLSDDSSVRLRALLLTELHAKAAQAADHEARASQLTGHTDVDSILERELADAGAARAREGIGEIKKALDRLDAGTYGWCEACGAPIPFERLEVIPEVQHCVACPRSIVGTVRSHSSAS